MRKTPLKKPDAGEKSASDARQSSLTSNTWILAVFVVVIAPCVDFGADPPSEGRSGGSR